MRERGTRANLERATRGRSVVMFRCWAVSAAIVTLAASAGAALAHSFNVAFVAPLSGPRANEGKRALDGFLLATREQDGHALETSDGHLGGLDSHVLTIDSAQGPEAVQQRLEAILREGELTFVTGILAPEAREAVAAALVRTRVILIEPTDSPAFRSAARAAGRVTTMDGRAFREVFRKAYPYAPDEYATKGYIAARLIAAAVRAAGVSVSDPAALRSAVDRARVRLD